MANEAKKENWWDFLLNILKEKKQKGEPLKTLTGVKNEILEVGRDHFVVRSEKRKSLDKRLIHKKRVEYVLKIVIKKGFYDSISAGEYLELMDFDDKSGLKGAHTAIIRGLLVYLPFIKKEGRARIVFSSSDYDKTTWDID